MKMNGNSVLLDTNIVIALFNGEPPVSEKLDLTENIFIPSIVVGELYYGALNSGNQTKNVDTIKSFIDNYVVLSIDQQTAIEYAIIKLNLKKSGKQIPENDNWIAAIAKQHNLPLVTRDRHFDYVEAIKKMEW